MTVYGINVVRYVDAESTAHVTTRVFANKQAWEHALEFDLVVADGDEVETFETHLEE